MIYFFVLLGHVFCVLKKICVYCIGYYNSSIISGGGRLSGYVTLVHPENIYVGKGSFVNGGRLQASENAKISIGENCIISYNVHLRTSTHVYENKNIFVSDQGGFEKDIIVGNDVWIGYGVQIMAGVHIADGCVIGAGAIVIHDTEPYGVYVGVPAKLVKSRKDVVI